jgi:Tfp pilus assembly protein PilV
MKCYSVFSSQAGYSLTEMLIAIIILIPVMGAAVSLFKTGANQHSSEQRSIDANQEARSALETMTMEIAQAGSHGDRFTATTAAISPSSVAQTVTLNSAEGILAGDWVDVDMGGTNIETLRVEAVSGNSISCIFLASHVSGCPVGLFARPFVSGVLPPSEMTANSSVAVTTLRFYGVLGNSTSGGNSVVQYVEYVYDRANNQITRSATPITQTTKNEALPFVRNVKTDSVQFTLLSDSRNAITSVNIAMTIVNPKAVGNHDEETAFSTKVLVPSISAASVLLSELQSYGGVNMMPPTPARVTTWISQ